MIVSSCRVTFSAQSLTSYWLGELDDRTQSEFEEHLFGCAACTERLQALVRLAEGVRLAARSGNVRAILTAPFVERLKELGVRVREYCLQSGGSVNCTAAPEDDMIVAHLQAPLHNVQRLDLVMHDSAEAAPIRLSDIAFDPMSDEVVMLSNAVQLRQRSFATFRAQLVAVEPDREAVIGEYTFNHSPYA
jgi:hypothetical protein